MTINMEEIEFRPCIPEDVNEAVPLILSSGPPAFNYVFTNKGSTATDFLKYAFQRKGGEFSFDNHYAVLLNQNLIGIGSVFSELKAKGFMLKDALNIVRFYSINASSVLIRGLRIEQILKLPQRNEICLAHLAIAENQRSKGYGQKLIQYLMGQVEKNSSDYFVLDVSEENPRAQQLYERLGFKVHKHVLSNYSSNYGYVPNFFRMEFK